MGGVREIAINEDKSVLYSGTHQFAYLLDAGEGAARPQAPSKAVREDQSGQWYMSWGDDNLWPQYTVEQSSKSDQIAPLINWKVKALISGGLIYGHLKFDAKGNELLVPFEDSEIDDFIAKTNLPRYAREATSDYFWFNNIFPEIILSGDRSKVATITVQEASYCRYAPQSKQTGLAPFVFISANWDKSPSESDVARVPLIDPYYDPAETMRNANGFRFIYACSFPSPGKFYYQDADWHNLFKSGWLDIEAAVPQTKKAIQKNQALIKFHIKVPRSYWAEKYKDWEDYSPEQKKALKKTELDAFNDFLTGEKNAGKSFMSEYEVTLEGTKFQGWIIEPIADPLKDGAYIEDSQEASAHIMRALSLDPTLVGAGPGKSQGSSGSGSDKRVARNIWLLNAKADADVILEPLMMLSRYNGWTKKYPKMVWWFRNYHIATMNQVEPENRL